jgi:hypothetical protein
MYLTGQDTYRGRSLVLTARLSFHCPRHQLLVLQITVILV